MRLWPDHEQKRLNRSSAHRRSPLTLPIDVTDPVAGERTLLHSATFTGSSLAGGPGLAPLAASLNGVPGLTGTGGQAARRSRNVGRCAEDEGGASRPTSGDAATAGLGDCSDWGLPTLAQLQSILDCTGLPWGFVDPVLGPDPQPAVLGSTCILTGGVGVAPTADG